jgi:uncharacterized RDD family membrane protein YckC
MAYDDLADENPYRAPVGGMGKPDAGYGGGYIGYAGFWLRFAAFVIDTILVTIVNGAIGFVLGILFAVAQGGQPSQDSLMVLQVFSGLVGLIIQAAYFAGMESSANQATLGKMALGIKVVDLDGRRISFLRALGRYFAKILSGLICAIGYIMAAFTEKKQGLHDMIAGTLVVKAG